jgi:hexosaminidase
VTVRSDPSENGPSSLILGVDDSYSLSINEVGSSCSIEAETVWGAINALETFTQLFIRDATNNDVRTKFAPVSIEDSSRFSHRGLMIDTSRHYLSIEAIKDIIDSLPMGKFNVLHIHLGDDMRKYYIIYVHI